MPGHKKLFLSLFNAELQDSLEGIEYLQKVYETRFRNNEITNYVYSENEAFLSHEAAGLKTLIGYAGKLNPDDYEDTGSMSAAVDKFFKEKVQELNNPEAVYGIIKRKIKKVLGYILEKGD